MTTKLAVPEWTTRLPSSDRARKASQNTQPGRWAPPVTYSFLQGAHMWSTGSPFVVYFVHREARAHPLELRVARVAEDDPPSDPLVEVLDPRARLVGGVVEGKVGLELAQGVAADGDSLVEEVSRGIDRHEEPRGAH